MVLSVTFEATFFGLLIRAESFRNIFDAPARRLPTLSALNTASGVAADRQRGVSWALVCSNHIGTPRRAIAGMIRIFILRPPTPFLRFIIQKREYPK
jgi:hypothetical protein